MNVSVGIQNCSYWEGCCRLGGSLGLAGHEELLVSPISAANGGDTGRSFLSHSLSNGWVSWNPVHRDPNGKLRHHHILLTPLTCAMRACVLCRFSPTLGDSMVCSPPGFSVHWILQARILEWVAIPFSRGSSPPRDQTSVSCGSNIAGRFFTTEPPGKPNAFIVWEQLLEEETFRKCTHWTTRLLALNHCKPGHVWDLSGLGGEYLLRMRQWENWGWRI